MLDVHDYVQSADAWKTYGARYERTDSIMPILEPTSKGHITKSIDSSPRPLADSVAAVQQAEEDKPTFSLFLHVCEYSLLHESQGISLEESQHLHLRVQQGVAGHCDRGANGKGGQST